MPTRSQCGQDGFVLSRFDEPGFFVEAGAANGLLCSNTKLLEDHGWHGICVEPYEPYYMNLLRNRKAATDRRALAGSTGATCYIDICTAKEMKGPLCGFGKTLPFSDRLFHRRQEVTTVKLHHLLSDHNAPREIEYLSLDIEGHELEVLQGFNFKYMFWIMTVEFQTDSAKGRRRRKKVHGLLASHGYRHFGFLGHDDIFINRAVAHKLKGKVL